jgi:8-oxo-dGTP diphosphatase
MPFSHIVLAAVFQVRDSRLRVLLWERALEPLGWALPGGRLGEDETLEDSIRRQLAAKVDVRDVAHLEQLETIGPTGGELTTSYLGLVPVGVDPNVPEDTAWHPLDALPPTAYDHGAIVVAARERLRAKLSYTNIAFALAPGEFTISELRDVYAAALGHRVTTTNLQRVLLRRRVLAATGAHRPPGPTGGRPAAVYRFGARRLEVTDPFAVLRPPDPPNGV